MATGLYKAGGGSSGPATQITETGGPTDLDVGAIADGELLSRSGGDVVGLAKSTFLQTAGVAGGQTVAGDTASGGNLTLTSTAHATKGAIIIAAGGSNEATTIPSPVLVLHRDNHFDLAFRNTASNVEMILGTYASSGNRGRIGTITGHALDLYAGGGPCIRLSDAGPVLWNTAGSASAPAIARTSNTGCGMYWPAIDVLGFVSNQTDIVKINATGLAVQANMFIASSVTAGITASTTQTQGQGALTNEINQISTCANANDTVTLPAASAGRTVLIINSGAETAQVFPASGDNLGGGVDTATTIAAGAAKRFSAYDSTNWKAETL